MSREILLSSALSIGHAAYSPCNGNPNSGRSLTMKRPVLEKDGKPGHKKQLRHSEPSKKRLKAMRAHKTGPLSKLESLPTELLEHIFSFTANPNFPRSSPFIGQKLSRPKIYQLQCRRLFRFFKAEGPCAPANSTQGSRTLEDHKEIARAQTETLKCRWMTPRLFEETRRSLLEDEESMRRRAIQEKEESMSLATLDGPVSEKMLHHLELWLGGNCRIPKKLIRWPLDHEALHFLDTLVMAGCEIDWTNSLDGERALDAWKDAVQHRDYRMVNRLMSFGIMVRPTERELEEALDSVNWETPMIKLIATSITYTQHPIRDGGLDFYSENYPSASIKIAAHHPHGSIGWKQLFQSRISDMFQIWQGSPRSLAASKHDNSARISFPRAIMEGTQYSTMGAHKYFGFSELGKWYPENNTEAQ